MLSAKLRVLLMVVALSACGGSTRPAPMLQPPAGWSFEASRLPEDTDAAVAQAKAELETTGLRRSFWPRDPERVSELRGQGLVVSEGPCGPTISAWVKVVPIDDPILAAERALELDAEGAVLAEWALPVNSVVGGIDGDQLLVPFRFSDDSSAAVPSMSIARDGTIGVLAIVPTSDPEPFSCPLLTRYGRSAYLRCMILPDRSSQERRRVAYELPCT